MRRRSRRLGDAVDDDRPARRKPSRRTVLRNAAIHAVADVPRSARTAHLPHDGAGQRLISTAAVIQKIKRFKGNPLFLQTLRRRMCCRAHEDAVRHGKRGERALRHIPLLRSEADDRDHKILSFCVVFF